MNGIVLEDAPTEAESSLNQFSPLLEGVPHFAVAAKEPRDGELDEEEELMREGLAEADEMIRRYRLSDTPKASRITLLFALKRLFGASTLP